MVQRASANKIAARSPSPPKAPREERDMNDRDAQANQPKVADRNIKSVGMVTGVARAAPDDPLAFILSENAYGNDVVCLLRPYQSHMAPAEHALVRVTGNIARDAASGRARHITGISAVTAIESPAPGAYRSARGAIPWKAGDAMPEERIRKMRDDWGNHPTENPAQAESLAIRE